MTKIFLFFALLLIAFGRVAPALADPPAVENAVLGTGFVKNKVVGASTTFTSNDPNIVCVVRLKGVDKSGQYRIRWWVVSLDEQQDFKVNNDDRKEHVIVDFPFDAKKQHANLLTSTFSFKSPANWPASAGPVPQHWPTGQYRVEIVRDDKPLRAVDFTIKAASAATTKP